MREKIRFIQREFSASSGHKPDYLLIVEVVENIPIASYNVKIPTRIALLPNSLHSKN